MNRNNILIVDDGKLNRVSFAAILRDSYGILEAENGKEALEVLAANKDSIALIILDIVMPVMDGFEFLEAYREVEEYRYIPVLVATTSDDQESERRCLELGAWDFISKTFHEEIIRFRVRNAIDKSKVRLLVYDSLTGLFNQQKFFQATRDMLDAAPDGKYAFIHYDIDRFKMINSMYGAKEGDRLICTLAESIRGAMSQYEGGTYGRIGGDVFAICIPYEHEDQIEDLLAEIKRRMRRDKVDYYLETCAGVYLVEDARDPVSVLFDNAAIAATQCKGKYMSHVAFYTKELSDKIYQEQHIIDDMDRALENEEFIVYFQPKYELKNLSPHGAEALVRWQKPDGTLIPPGDFIPVFERNGFIAKLDYYVWEKVCQFIRKELDEGREPDPISVNVSRVNLYSPNFVETLVDLVERYKIPPKYLNLEITESVFSDNASVIQNAVGFLHKAGFTILMDDFGSGYSSLNTLKDVDLDVLKIDMKFFTKGATKEKAEKIIEAVVKMAESLDMPVIAEGVEEKGQVDFLSDLGCNYIQGYYFARPMPEEQYQKLIEQDDGEK